jgi:hypothetical protein
MILLHLATALNVMLPTEGNRSQCLELFGHLYCLSGQTGDQQRRALFCFFVLTAVSGEYMELLTEYFNTTVGFPRFYTFLSSALTERAIANDCSSARIGKAPSDVPYT